MKVLIIVDLQNDFITGSLKVKGAEEIVPVANRLIVEGGYDVIVLTQDWHPPGHSSFISSNPDKKGWPDHCVMGTEGARLHSNLLPGRADLIIRKGTKKEVDSYSAFYDNDGTSIGLSGYLKDRGVDEVHIMGLATDVCVFYTALDSVKCGFDTSLIEDGCKAVEPKNTAIDEMKKAGVKIIQSPIYKENNK